MLSTIKILQAKNASTGTISMSKRLMAIQETFSSNLAANNPATVIRNGDINKEQKCETKMSSQAVVPTKPCKPNSLVLVANQQSLHQMSNGQVRTI